MKLLILSDLHISAETACSHFKLEKYKRILKTQISSTYDAVLISGDVFEHRVPHLLNVFSTLQYLFEKPVVFCLGNHEFAYESHESVLKLYGEQYKDFKECYPQGKVTCLDVSGFYDFDSFRVVGNVFWYDWSLNHCRTLMKGEILEGWLDATIENFDVLTEHEKCKAQILSNLNGKQPTVLLTHTVPHSSLNTFSFKEPYSPYNAYSGTEDFLKELSVYNVKYAFCGHTHCPENRTIYGIECMNLGNDYFFKTNKVKWAIFEVNESLDLINVELSR